MSGFGGFSFGNNTAQQPNTTTASTFGSTNTQLQSALPTFGSTVQQTTTGFGATSPFGTSQQTSSTTNQPQQTGSLFNLGGTTNQPQQQTTGIAFNFSQNKTQPGTIATSQAQNTPFGTSLFATSTAAPTATNQLTTNTGSTFNFNLSGASLANNQTTTSSAPTFSLSTTVAIPQTTQSSFINTANTTGLTQNLTNQQATNQLITGTNQPNLLNTSTTATTKPSSGFNLNLNFGQTTTGQTTTTTAPTSITTTTTSLTTLPVTTSQVTNASTTTTTISNQTQQQQQNAQQPQQPTQLTFKQLEGYINVWLNELNQMEADFQTQSQTINSWDSLLVNNGLKITNVNESLDLLKEEHKRIDQQLDFVISQQNELEQLLEPLEKIQVDFNVNDTASTEREFTYSLVDTVSNDLQGIGTELQNFIKKLNETKANQDLNDPLSSISKILNSHIDALQYIEHQINVLKRNIEA